MKKKNKKIKIEIFIKSSLLLLVFSVMTYIYMINFATFNTAKAQTYSDQISILKSEISDLEVAYMEKNKSINLEKASEFNLVKNENKQQKVFVQKDLNTRLTFVNTQE